MKLKGKTWADRVKRYTESRLDLEKKEEESGYTSNNKSPLKLSISAAVVRGGGSSYPSPGSREMNDFLTGGL